MSAAARPVPVPSPAEAQPADPRALDVRLHHALADELIAMTQLLSDLAYDLGSDPATLRLHMKSLQSIDRLTQIQCAIADVLRSDEPIDQRVRAITLEDMAARLSTRLLLDSGCPDGREPGRAAMMEVHLL